MNKDSKFYNYVEKLIRENSKIKGNEDLVDTIIDDVFAKAHVVLNTISDENVIEEFLNKTVSTSVITVVKRLGSNKHTVSSANELINKINSSKENTINKDYVDNFINGCNIIHENTIQKDLNTNQTEQITVSENILNELNIDYSDNDNQNTDDIDILINDSNSTTDANSCDNVQQTTLKEDESQFNVTNDVSISDDSDTESELTFEFKSETEDYSEQEPDINNDSEEFIEIEQSDENVLPDIMIQENFEDEDTITKDSILLSVDDTDVSEEVVQADKIDNYEILDDDSNDSFSNLDDVALNDDQLIETDSCIELDTPDDSQEELFDGNSSDINLDADTGVADEIEESSTQRISDYGIFEFSPVSQESDEKVNIKNQIIEKLNKLELQEPELKILEIFEQKYIQNKNINDIATALSLDTKAVIDALNKMVDIV